ncbi:hypothetical protein LG302_06385 [Halomonas organivorans]
MDYLTLAFVLAVVAALAALASLLLLPRVLREATPRRRPGHGTAADAERPASRPRTTAVSGVADRERRRTLPPEVVAMLMRRHG